MRTLSEQRKLKRAREIKSMLKGTEKFLAYRRANGTLLTACSVEKYVEVIVDLQLELAGIEDRDVDLVGWFEKHLPEARSAALG